MGTVLLILLAMAGAVPVLRLAARLARREESGGDPIGWAVGTCLLLAALGTFRQIALHLHLIQVADPGWYRPVGLVEPIVYGVCGVLIAVKQSAPAALFAASLYTFLNLVLFDSIPGSAVPIRFLFACALWKGAFECSQLKALDAVAADRARQAEERWRDQPRPGDSPPAPAPAPAPAPRPAPRFIAPELLGKPRPPRPGERVDPPVSSSGGAPSD